MSHIDLPDNLKHTHNQHRNKFTNGYKDVYFEQELRTFLQQVKEHYQKKEEK